MPLVFLANTAWKDAAQLKVTDTADTATTDTTGLENVTGGQRWHRWTSGATADRRIAYINKSGGMSCTYAVLTRADLHVGHQVMIHSWSNYTSSATTELDTGTTWAPTLIGERAQDYVWNLTSNAISSKQALTMTFLAGTGGNYTKTVGQIYFSNGLSLSYPGPVQISKLAFPSTYVYDRQAYIVDEEWQFVITQMSRAEVETFETQYMLQRRPIFIYDTDGTLIPTKLLHCMIKEFRIVEVFDDFYAIQLEVVKLRQWA